MITEKGYQNIIEIAERWEFKIDQEFIDENLEALSDGFAKADEPDHLLDYPDGPVWWTFEAEVNSGGISDTYPRDKLLSNISQALLGMDIPTYGDSDEVQNKFMEKLNKYHSK